MGTPVLVQGNATAIPLPDRSVQCVVTSPPYWSLRDYGVDGQIGLEQTPDEYVARMVQVFREVRRVLRDDGTLWLVLGDSYAGGGRGGQNGDAPNWAGSKQQTNRGCLGMPTSNISDGLKTKDLVGIPWRVAFALQADGWWLRSDCIWHKPNPMPESVTDRPTKAHEYVFLLSKSARYFYDAEAVKEPMAEASAARYQYGFGIAKNEQPKRTDKPTAIVGDRNVASGRNRRTVWTIPTAGWSGAHYATYPPALVEPCIKAGTSERGCCPECGAPWGRVIERKRGIPASYNGSAFDKGKTRDAREPLSAVGSGPRTVSTTTVGWRPTCTCGAGDPIPCLVLDPFCGSGTTLLVARALGRDSLGLDLSYAYLHDQARARLQLDKLAAWYRGAQSSSLPS